MSKVFIKSCFILGGLFIIGLLFWNISHHQAREKADATIKPFEKYIEYQVSFFSLSGGKDSSYPSWIFIYGDPYAFDGSEVRVQVSLLGRLLAVYPPEIIINTNYVPPTGRSIEKKGVTH